MVHTPLSFGIARSITKWAAEKFLATVESSFDEYVKKNITEEISLVDVLAAMREHREQEVVALVKTGKDLLRAGEEALALREILHAANLDKFAAIPRLWAAALLWKHDRDHALAKAEEAFSLNPYLFPQLTSIKSGEPFLRPSWKVQLLSPAFLMGINSMLQYSGSWLKSALHNAKRGYHSYVETMLPSLRRSSAAISNVSANASTIVVQWSWGANLRISQENLIGCFDAATGTPLWARRLSDGEELYFSSESIVCIKDRSGTLALISIASEAPSRIVSAAYFRAVLNPCGAQLERRPDFLAANLQMPDIGYAMQYSSLSLEPKQVITPRDGATTHDIRRFDWSNSAVVCSPIDQTYTRIRATNKWGHQHFVSANQLPVCLLGCAAEIAADV